MYTDPSGHKAKPSYEGMRALTYVYMKTIVHSDPTFSRIKFLNSRAASYAAGAVNPSLIGATDVVTTTLALNTFKDMVCEDCAWDMKSVIGDAYGIDQKGTPETGTEDIYFDMPGTDPNVETNFNMFGNVMYGYIGAAAGFTFETIVGAAALVDTYNHKRPNAPDLAAVALGYKLWQWYGENLTEADLDAAFRLLAQTGNTHTRRKRPANAD